MKCSEAGYGEQGNLMQGWETRRGLCINACKCQQHYGGNWNREVHWMCRFKHCRQTREREGSIGNTLLRSFAVQTHHTPNSVSYLARSISGWKCLLIKDTPLCHASAVVQQQWYRSGFPAQLCFLLMLFSSSVTARILPLRKPQWVSQSWKTPLVLSIQDCCQKRHHFIVIDRPKLCSTEMSLVWGFSSCRLFSCWAGDEMGWGGPPWAGAFSQVFRCFALANNAHHDLGQAN